MTPSTMQTDRLILTCLRLPARLDVQQTATLLGLQEHDIPLLVRARLLKPLGKPASNSIKYFSSATVQNHANDCSWLDKATLTISQHWRTKRRHVETHSSTQDS